jgi:hypothetical protein
MSGMHIRPWIVWTTAVMLVVAGCGGRAQRSARSQQVTVPAYGVIPATTVGREGRKATDGRTCRAAARSFAEDSADLLAHFGVKAAYPADLNYVIVRSELAGFRAGRCDLRLLGRALEQRLSPNQRTDLVADLPRTMGAVVREALARAGVS